MTLYISNYPLLQHQPLQKRISAIDHHNKRIWTTGLETCDPFIIQSYDFDRFIFFIDYKEIDRLWKIDTNKKVSVVMKNCTDEMDALYHIGTDININIRCYFEDSIGEIFDEILRVYKDS
jgi:hypothetical protein